MLGVSPGVATSGGIGVRVAVGTGMAECVSFSLRGLLFLLLRVESPGLIYYEDTSRLI